MFSLKMILALISMVCVAITPVAAQYAQLSSTVSQKNGALGKGVAITFNSIDAIATGIAFTKGTSTITVNTAGTYFIVASPQVGFFSTAASCSKASPFTADYWIVQNGKAVANTGVRLVAPGSGTDVIVSQGIFILKAGDKIQVFGSGTCSGSLAFAPAGEATIPSIIFSMYKI
jgi:hypothetical protein